MQVFVVLIDEDLQLIGLLLTYARKANLMFLFNVETARLFGPFLGALVALVGFLFVYAQLRNQSRGVIYQLSNSVYKLFVDVPDLRPYFYDNMPLPNVDKADARNRVLATAELLCDYFEHIHHTRGLLPNELWKAWRLYMQMLHDSSEAMQFFLGEMESQYSPSFITEIRAGSGKSKLGSVRV